jgi:hypothetical protein
MQFRELKINKQINKLCDSKNSSQNATKARKPIVEHIHIIFFWMIGIIFIE